MLSTPDHALIAAVPARACADVELVRAAGAVCGGRFLAEGVEVDLRAAGAHRQQHLRPRAARIGDGGRARLDRDVREQEVAFTDRGRDRRRERGRARAVLDAGAARAVRDRVDHVRNRELGVVEVESEQLRLAPVDEPPPCARRRDVLAVRVEDLRRAEQHVRDAPGLVVDEADPAAVEQTRARRPVELPGPRTPTLTALDRQVLLEAFLVERDGLRTERRRAVRAAFEAPPCSRTGGGERDGREVGGETEPRVRHVHGQTRCRPADEGRRLLRRAQSVPQKCRRRACAVLLLSAGELSQEQQADESHPKGGGEHEPRRAEAPGRCRALYPIAAVQRCSPRTRLPSHVRART